MYSGYPSSRPDETAAHTRLQGDPRVAGPLAARCLTPRPLPYALHVLRAPTDTVLANGIPAVFTRTKGTLAVFTRTKGTPAVFTRTKGTLAVFTRTKGTLAVFTRTKGTLAVFTRTK